jgi:hypothetical protein
LDDLPLYGLELGQPLHCFQVVEGDAQVLGEGDHRGLVDSVEPVAPGMDQEEGAEGHAAGPHDSHGEAARRRRQLEALEEPAVRPARAGRAKRSISPGDTPEAATMSARSPNPTKAARAAPVAARACSVTQSSFSPMSPVPWTARAARASTSTWERIGARLAGR